MLYGYPNPLGVQYTPIPSGLAESSVYRESAGHANKPRLRLPVGEISKSTRAR